MTAFEEVPVAEEESAPESSYRGGRGSFIRKPRICQFCVEKTKTIDYKQVDLLRRLVMERGKIRPRRQTGTCALHQRALAIAVKRARHMALLPFSDD
jgi:small subunit ribosomal protein S18